MSSLAIYSIAQHRSLSHNVGVPSNCADSHIMPNPFHLDITCRHLVPLRSLPSFCQMMYDRSSIEVPSTSLRKTFCPIGLIQGSECHLRSAHCRWILAIHHWLTNLTCSAVSIVRRRPRYSKVLGEKQKSLHQWTIDLELERLRRDQDSLCGSQ